ncbi:hypothetical protein ACFE04_026328 [Oxalis oulophora]
MNSKTLSLLKFNQAVKSAEFDSGSGFWRVTIKFDNIEYLSKWLVVASGENVEPDFLGMGKFHGPVIHTSVYKSGCEFKNKKLLVIGCGNSGMEDSLDLCRHNAKPYMVSRNTVEFWRMGFYWTWALLLSYFYLLFNSNSYPSPPTPPTPQSSNPIITTPICIITGATSGIGKALAFSLSKQGFFILLAGRSTRNLFRTVEEIKHCNKDAQVKAFQLDVSSLQSILNFRNSLQKWLLDSNFHCSVQLLINNAGILATTPRCSQQGFDQVMATNYFGPFFLTNILLPFLGNSPVPSRIVNVTSFTHRSISHVHVDKDAVIGKCFTRLKRYPCAHCAFFYSRMSFTENLVRWVNFIMSPLCSVADPGAVKTNIMRELPLCISYLALFGLKFLGFLQTPENGVSAILDAALAPPVSFFSLPVMHAFILQLTVSREISGLHFFGGKGRVINSSKLSYDPKHAEQLWTTSSEILQQMKFPNILGHLMAHKSKKAEQTCIARRAKKDNGLCSSASQVYELQCFRMRLLVLLFLDKAASPLEFLLTALCRCRKRVFVNAEGK